MDFIIKVENEGSLKRVRFSSDEELSFGKLEAMIRSLLNAPPRAQLRATYSDKDGDDISVESDDELRDACVKQGLNPLRMRVTFDQHSSRSQTGAAGSSGDLTDLGTTGSTNSLELEFDADGNLLYSPPSVFESVVRIFENFIDTDPVRMTDSLFAPSEVHALLGNVLKMVSSHPLVESEVRDQLTDEIRRLYEEVGGVEMSSCDELESGESLILKGTFPTSKLSQLEISLHTAVNSHGEISSGIREVLSKNLEALWDKALVDSLALDSIRSAHVGLQFLLVGDGGDGDLSYFPPRHVVELVEKFAQMPMLLNGLLSAEDVRHFAGNVVLMIYAHPALPPDVKIDLLDHFQAAYFKGTKYKLNHTPRDFDALIDHLTKTVGSHQKLSEVEKLQLIENIMKAFFETVEFSAASSRSSLFRMQTGRWKYWRN